MKIAVITAVFGLYETTLKKQTKQTVDCDFICFSDSNNIKKNGWVIDNTKYHETNPAHLDDGTFINSIKNNTHTFNIAKYYKQNFYNIPVLKKYDFIFWIDGTIEITNRNTIKESIDILSTHFIVSMLHARRQGLLINEVVESEQCKKYTETFWFNQKQPVQDVRNQFNTYKALGYNPLLFRDSNVPNAGVWTTCFIGFNMKNPKTIEFLDNWYLQTLKYTTQDQVSFPFICWQHKIKPYSLPDIEIEKVNKYMKKHKHGN